MIICTFLSTLSLRRATFSAGRESDTEETFLSTLSLRRATGTVVKLQCILGNFYPRSPCGERPLQLKPPIKSHRHFYPRSPCGERRQAQSLKVAALSISIHALLAESDGPMKKGQVYYIKFLSTLSLRRATKLAEAIKPS